MKTTIPFALILLLALSACRQDHSQLAQVNADSLDARVTVQEIPITETPLTIEAVGLLSGTTEMKQSFKIGGVIDRIFVDEGQRYRAGQVLAVLETREIDAQVNKARQAVEKFQRDQVRIDNLYQDTVATLEQLQDIKTGLDVALADLEIAEYNQGYAQIVARNRGKVLRRFAEEGEMISPGMPVLMVSHTGGGGMFVLKVGLPDKDIVRLQPGDSAHLEFDAFPGEKFTAQIGTIAPQADPMTGSFAVELELESRGFPMRHGFVGKAEIFPRSGGAYYKVPIDAVVEANENEARIFLVDPETQTVAATTIPSGRIGPDYVLVDTSAIRLDRPVVLAGANYLEDGQKIAIQ
ncbi:MAG: efflux RND transporter periplasmic adaptor subunit [Bacteroidota bacterium]